MVSLRILLLLPTPLPSSAVKARTKLNTLFVRLFSRPRAIATVIKIVVITSKSYGEAEPLSSQVRSPQINQELTLPIAADKEQAFIFS